MSKTAFSKAVTTNHSINSIQSIKPENHINKTIPICSRIVGKLLMPGDMKCALNDKQNKFKVCPIKKASIGIMYKEGKFNL
jgi:hypothetical protein